MFRLACRLILIGLTVFPYVTSAVAVTITRICSDEILIEDGTSNTGMYVGYEILNDGAATIADVWVTLDGFSGGVVSLAPNETGTYSLGTLVPGEAQNAYLYLKANGSTQTPQTHTVNVRLGSPSNPPVGSANFSYTAAGADPSLPCNEVHTVSVSGSPVVGALITVTVAGETGAVASPSDYVATPASAADFPASTFRLIAVNTRMSTVSDRCVTQVFEVNGSMIIATPPDAAGYCYETTYTFRAQEPTAAPTPISPRQYIVSGTQAKFQCPDAPGGVIPLIEPALWKGTEFSPLGDAVLTRTPETLMVENIGSSGLDGVSFYFGASQGGRLSWDGSVIVTSVGTTIRFEMNAAGGVLPCVKVLRESAALTRTTPEFGPVPIYGLTVEVWDDGNFVAEYTDMQTDVTSQDMPFAVEVDNDLIPETLEAPFAPHLGCRVLWETDQLFELTAIPGTTETGDELRFIADDYWVTYITSLGVRFETTSAPIAVEFTDLHQLMFGRRHQADGGQLLSSLTAPPIPPPGPTAVHHSGAGARPSAMADHMEAKMTAPPGVLSTMRFELDANETGLGVLWDAGNLATAGDLVDNTAYGETGGLNDEVVLVTVCEESDGTAWDVTPDFTGAGSATIYLRVLDEAGNVVHEVPDWSGSVAVQTGDYATTTELLDNDVLGFELGYPSAVGVVVPGHGTYQASRVQMLSNAPKNYTRLTAVERAITILPGGTFAAFAELNAKVLAAQGNGASQHIASGVAYIREYDDHLVIENIGPSGLDGVIIGVDGSPVVREVQIQRKGGATAQYGETDFQFLQRLMGEDLPLEMMSLNLSSDGTAVHVKVSPGQSSTPLYEVTLKRGGIVETTFSHSDPSVPIADLPEWPIGAGYHVLEYPDQPWAMVVDLGQEMNVSIPGGPTLVSGPAAVTTVPADVIVVVAQQTPQPPAPVERFLGLKVKNFFYFPYKKKNSGGPTGIDREIPESSALHVAYPNPFNPRTTLVFDLAHSGRATLTIYDVSGAVVSVVHDGVLAAGPHELHWDGTDLRGVHVASGVYFVELRAPDGRSHTKINLLK